MTFRAFGCIMAATFIFTGCKTLSRNDIEKKIEGKWHQVGGIGIMANIDLLFDYTFTDKKEFIRQINAPNDKTVIYRDWPDQKGTFEIINDSIFLYQKTPELSVYSARIQFEGERKFTLYDGNGQLTYER